MIRNTPRYLQGAMGVFGWLDTTLPVLGYAVYFGAVLLVAVLAVTSTGRRGMWTVLGTVALAMLVPIFVQSYSVSQTGIIWQGRYALFLYVGVLLVAAWLLSGPAATRIAFLSVRVTAIVVVLLAAYGILAYVIALRRYVVGAHGDIGAMIRDPHWQPPLGWPTLAAIMTVTIVAFSAWVIHRAVEAVRADDSVPKAIG